VKQSGGHLTVDSQQGCGTTFKIYLPEVDSLHSSQGQPVQPKAAPRGAETILLVEDEEEVRLLARLVLEASGYKVVETSHGGEAVRLAERYPGPIDLLVSDVVMPEMGGRLLAERVAMARPQIKVLFMSGYTEDAVVRHGVLQTAVAFLQKPFTPATLA